MIKVCPRINYTKYGNILLVNVAFQLGHIKYVGCSYGTDDFIAVYLECAYFEPSFNLGIKAHSESV